MKFPRAQPFFAALALCVIAGACTAAPAEETSHPRLVQAQADIEQSIQLLSAAQDANGHDFDGHVAQAKQLLQQALIEVRAALAAADAQGR